MKKQWQPKFKVGDNVYGLVQTISEGRVFEAKLFRVIAVDGTNEAYFIQGKRKNAKIYRVVEACLDLAHILNKEEDEIL